MVKRYFDFELQISSSEDELTVDVNGRPYAINLSKPIKVPLKVKPASWRSVKMSSPGEIAPLGHSLYDLVFRQEVESRFQAYLNRREQDEGVRLCIQAQTIELFESIWEILCSQVEPSTSFLALDPRSPVVRCPRIGKEVYLREIRAPLRLLVVLASPRRVQRIDPITEKLVLEQALGPAVASRRIIIEYLGFDDPTSANFDTLQDHLADGAPYDIVHIIGHGLLEEGREGITALVDPDTGKQQEVVASSLANLFRSRSVLLVILQSCQSGGVDPSVAVFSSVAHLLVASGVPAVLAMQEVIDQDVATHFLARLYAQWLQRECLLEDALTQARQSVLQKFPDRIAPWAIPVLYICPGVQLVVNRKASPPAVETKEGRVDDPVATRERQVDAALPQYTRVGKETELVVLIRVPSMPGLREILGAKPQDWDVTPEDVRTSSAFEVAFPVDEATGKTLPASVRIQLESGDFDLRRSEDKVQIRPQSESVLCRFPVYPRRAGALKLSVRVVGAEETSLAQLVLRSTARKGVAFETEYRVVDGLPAEVSPEISAGSVEVGIQEMSAPSLSSKEMVHIRQNLEGTPDIEEAAELMNLAGSATRLKLLYLLNNMKELNIVDLAEMLGISVSAVSQHLAKLKTYGLVAPRRDAQTIYYRLTDHGFNVKLHESVFRHFKV